MPHTPPSIINMALVGGGEFCREVLEKTTFDYEKEDVTAPILAVADPDIHSVGMALAKELGLLTFRDYHALYDPRYSIHLITILTPDPLVLEDILNTRPPRIRIMSYHVFKIFWEAISAQERKLRERTREMETIVNGIEDFILVITPDLAIVEANEPFLRKMETRREAVIGRKCHMVFEQSDSPCSDPQLLCPLKDVIRNKRHTRQIRTRIGKNNELRHWEINVYPIWEKAGMISKFIHISRDITEQLKAEEEMTRRLEEMVEERTRQLQQTHEKLLHQDKMASLGKLSASVVHELNNPIAGILNLILLIKRIMGEEHGKMGEKDQIVRYLDLMETETRRTSRIVSNLLAFSRQSEMKLTRVDLNRLIEKTLIINSNLLKIHGIKVNRRLDPDLPELVGSEDQLQQVFMNIISNAGEAMEATGPGVLTIETRHRPKSGRVVASVTDTGPGIPQENFSNLFEPFFTTKKEGKGVGLGLSVAYGIVQEHSGSIYVRSKQGKGATFIVDLPVERSNDSK